MGGLTAAFLVYFFGFFCYILNITKGEYKMWQTILTYAIMILGAIQAILTAATICWLVYMAVEGDEVFRP